MSDDLDLASLGRWMAGAAPALGRPIAAEKLTRGQSNPTYRLACAEGRAVLRRKPFGTLLQSAHAIEREYAVIAALGPTGFPVPAPIALCEDPGVIGAPFYLMAEVSGRSFVDGRLPALDPPDRRAAYESMVDALAALHALDPAAIGLGDFGRPGNYFARQVERWTRQYRAAETDRNDEIEALIEWLPGTVPAQERTALIHGDYRIDNLIFAPDRPAVAAVVDWELSTIGDPLADVSYLLMHWLLPADGRAGLAGADIATLGIPDAETMLRRYCDATGRGTAPDLRWLIAFNLFRLCGIVQGIRKRIVDGNASGRDAVETAAVLPMLARAAWAQARGGGEGRPA